MGSSSGGGYGGRPEGIDELLERAQRRERERLKGDIDRFLSVLLATINDRDTVFVSEKLDDMSELLSGVADLEQVLLGGSVSKHTFVDGLSDVDALVILDPSSLDDKSPRDVIRAFRKILESKLPRQDVKSISEGKMAVTVTFMSHDNIEIQLLPALQKRGKICVPSWDGADWRETRPKVFQKKLTVANGNLNQSLIPAIKLMKLIVRDFPQQKRLTGYHIEALAVDAAKSYQGPKTTREVLLHLLEHSSKRVLSPISDVTLQTRILDEYLGKSESVARKNVSVTLQGMGKRLKSATSVKQWESALEPK
jgi:predicted nucleotidyltransferase